MEIVEQGQRVFLRHPVAEDRAEFDALIEQSVEFLKPWEPRVPAGGESRFDRIYRMRHDGHNLKFFVCRAEDGAIAGCMNINNIVRGVFRNGMLGYWIGAPYARQGCMGEALQLALRHAFEALTLHRVEANIMPNNEASIALVKRAGFRLEGVSRKYLKIAGRWSDHERWALLAEEWTP